MLVVADTSPLSALAELGHADVLPALFGHILIPPEVAAELSHPRAPLAARQLAMSPHPWLEVKRPRVIQAVQSLNPGEAAAIALARECAADLLLIDEKTGRRVAESLGLNIIGAVGVLGRAADAGLVDLQEAFRRLRKTRFAVADAILDAALERHLARRKKTT